MRVHNPTVICNGFYKAGNHALVRAVELLGIPTNIEHLPFTSPALETPVSLFVKRDPRDILCSTLRFDKGGDVNPGTFLSLFRAYYMVAQSLEMAGMSLVENMAPFEGWLTDPHTHVIEHEDLINSEATHRQIAEWCHTPYFEGAHAKLPGWTMSWRKGKADYKEVWTPDVQAVWEAEGGNELLKRWGYA